MAAAEAAAKRKSKAAADITSETKDLTDEKVQAEILNPEGMSVKLFGDDVLIHPLPVKWAIRFSGFAYKVLCEIQGMTGLAWFRVGSSLAENHLDEFLPFVSRALHRADASVGNAQMDKLIEEINEKMTAADTLRTFGEIFLLMVSQNDTLAALGLNPKPKN